jgi:hypothetical protein
MTKATEKFNPLDPTGMFKVMQDTSMDAWAKMMVEVVNTDAYAESTGKMLDTYLASSGPFRKTIETSMTLALANLNMPSLEDLNRLAARLTNIEMRLDDLDAKLDECVSKVS